MSDAVLLPEVAISHVSLVWDFSAERRGEERSSVAGGWVVVLLCARLNKTQKTELQLWRGPLGEEMCRGEEVSNGWRVGALCLLDTTSEREAHEFVAEARGKGEHASQIRGPIPRCAALDDAAQAHNLKAYVNWNVILDNPNANSLVECVPPLPQESEDDSEYEE